MVTRPISATCLNIFHSRASALKNQANQLGRQEIRSFVSSRLNADTTFTKPEITIEQITEIILKIPNNKATGHDGISVDIVGLDC